MPTGTSVAEKESGSLVFVLVDDDGEHLPGRFAYEWSGRDPLELTIYTVTELSGRPWKWTTRRPRRATLSAQRCRALAIRTGKALRKESRTVTAAVLARIIAQECLRPGAPPPDTAAIAAILSGKREADWEAGPLETAPAMLRALRAALKAAVEAEVGLAVLWGSPDDD